MRCRHSHRAMGALRPCRALAESTVFAAAYRGQGGGLAAGKAVVISRRTEALPAIGAVLRHAFGETAPQW